MESNQNEQQALLQSLLANKDIQKKLRELMPPSPDDEEETEEESKQSNQSDVPISNLLPLLQSALASSGSVNKNDPKNALLLALKPFLSEKRQRAVDMLLSLSSLGGMMGQIR